MSSSKKKPSFSKAILNLIVLVPTLFGLLRKVIGLVEIEAQLAGRSIIQLVVLSVALGSLLTATWVGVLIMLYMYFQTLLWTPLLSLFILVLINILILCIILYCISRVKKNLFFPEVRSHLRSLQRLVGK